MDKMMVKEHWNKLKDKIDGIIALDEETIERAKAIINDPQPKLFEPEKPRSIIEALSLAFWYIKRVGDVGVAEKAMKAAIHAVKDVS